ncbi:MAG: hypothetical protein U0821_24485 [Chloroflexota bacterium]
MSENPVNGSAPEATGKLARTFGPGRRRVMLRWLAAGVGAGLLAQRTSERVEATDGQPILAATTNTASTLTTLSAGPPANVPGLVVKTNFGAANDAFNDGVQGYAIGANNAGAFGRNNDVNGIGISGQATNGTGAFGDSSGGSGVAGTSVTGAGVFGQVTNPAGQGGRFDNTDPNGTGLLATSNNGAGAGIAVLAQSNTGIAVDGRSNLVGLRGLIPGTANGQVAVQGFCTTGAVGSLGMQGVSPGGIGLLGETNTGTGFAGRANNSGGAAGTFQNNTAGIAPGVATVSITNLAAASAPDQAKGLIVNGNVEITNGRFTVIAGAGFKNAVMPTSRGLSRMYCLEASVSVFEDYGRSRLTNGSARVVVDPLFLETIESDFDVYLTPRGRCNGLYVEFEPGAFIVREVGAGTSNIEFGYRIVGQAKGLTAAHRLATHTSPTPVKFPEAPDYDATLRNARAAVRSAVPRLPTLPDRTGGGGSAPNNRTATPASGNPGSAPPPRR